MGKVPKKSSRKVNKSSASFFIANRSAFFLGFIGLIAILGVVSMSQMQIVLSQHTEDEHSGRYTTIVNVTPASLDATSSNPAVVATDGLNKWFMYNDTNDTIDNTLGSFVTGPAKPFYGIGSIEFTLAASPLDRKNIATYQFSGTPLSSVTQMSFGVYSHSGVASSSEDPFLNFNVDFTGSSSAFQRRLVYVPSINGTVLQNTWQKWDAITGGTAQWTWSGYTANGNKWPDNNTNQYRTWADIRSSFPQARLLPVGGWLGIRVGEPGPTGYTADVDFFSITKGSKTTIYNFDPAASPSASPTPDKDHCERDGWKNFHNPSFKDQGDCDDYVRHHKDNGDNNNQQDSNRDGN